MRFSPCGPAAPGQLQVRSCGAASPPCKGAVTPEVPRARSDWDSREGEAKSLPSLPPVGGVLRGRSIPGQRDSDPCIRMPAPVSWLFLWQSGTTTAPGSPRINPEVSFPSMSPCTCALIPLPASLLRAKASSFLLLSRLHCMYCPWDLLDCDTLCRFSCDHIRIGRGKTMNDITVFALSIALCKYFFLRTLNHNVALYRALGQCT